MHKTKYSVGIGFTSSCNMKCSFCYSKDKRDESNDIALDVWLAFIQNNHNEISCINYGTGENALAPNWFLLVKYIGMNYPDITQAVTTNGSLGVICNNDIECKDIVVSHIKEIDVSLDYGDPQKHNSIRNTLNAYDNVIETLKFCQCYGIQATIVIMGIEETIAIENLKMIFSIAQKYNAYIRINIYRPVRKTDKFKTPSLDSIIKMLDWVADNHRIIALSDPFFSAVCTDNDFRPDPSGVSSVRITQDGLMYPSTYLLGHEFLLGSITENNILSSISNLAISQQFIESPIPSTCKECVFVTRCRGGAVDRRCLTGHKLSQVRDPLCPGAFREKEPLRNYNIYQGSFHSVHESYLPTLFFAPINKEF